MTFFSNQQLCHIFRYAVMLFSDPEPEPVFKGRNVNKQLQILQILNFENRDQRSGTGIQDSRIDTDLTSK